MSFIFHFVTMNTFLKRFLNTKWQEIRKVLNFFKKKLSYVIQIFVNFFSYLSPIQTFQIFKFFKKFELIYKKIKGLPLKDYVSFLRQIERRIV